METHLALIIDDIADGYQLPLMAGVHDACRQHKLPLRVYTSGMYFPLHTGDCKYGGLIFDLVNESDCIGLIIPIQIYQVIANQIDILKVFSQRPDLPIVLIGEHEGDIPSIRMDNKEGIRQAMRHFIVDHGLQKIAVVNGPLSNTEAKLRFDAYVEQLQHFRLPLRDDYICPGTFHFNDGIAAIDRLHQLDEPPQGLVAADDYMALGAMQRAQELHWPIQIIGFDNIEAATVSQPPLTTVDQDLYHMGKAAADKLRRRIKHQHDQLHSLFAPKLIVRQSCGCQDQLQHAILGDYNQKELTFDIGELQKSAIELSELLNIERQEMPHALFLVEKLLLEVCRQLNLDHHCKQAVSIYQELVSLHQHASWLDSCKQMLQAMLELFLQRELAQVQQLFLRQLRFQCTNLINRNLLLEQQSNFDRMQQHKRDIDEFCQAINTCFSIIDLVDVLRAHSVVFELGDFAVGLYKSNKQLQRYPRSAPKWSTVIFDKLAAVNNQSYSIATAQLVQRKHSDRLLVLPLNHKGMEFGYLVVSYKPDLLKLYSAIAFHLGFALKNIYTIRHSQQDEKKLKATLAQLRGANAALEHSSVTDELTGLLNRRGFYKAAQQHIRYAKQHKDAFVIGYADLDGLKAINDELGHEQGDMAIWLAGQVLMNCFRRTDLVARLSGDEFAFLLIDTDAAHITAAQSKIHHFCNQANLSGVKFNVSMSVGFAAFNPKDPLSLKDLLSHADAQLYDNKVWKKENQLLLPTFNPALK